MINFGKQHRHTLKNDVLIQLSFFPLLVLTLFLLNSSDGNDAMLTSLCVCKD